MVDGKKRIVVVTGATRGIGRALVSRLIEIGHAVIGCGRSQAGIDELRFNIADDDYDLGPVRDAKWIIPRVTIEIPAIPEDEDRLRRILPDMAALGLDHLNLHQLMVTGGNAPQLAARGYTFLRS